MKLVLNGHVLLYPGYVSRDYLIIRILRMDSHFLFIFFFFQSKCTLKPNRNAQTILGLLQTVVDCTQIIKTAYLKYEGKHVLHVASAG